MRLQIFWFKTNVLLKLLLYKANLFHLKLDNNINYQITIELRNKAINII